MNKLQPFSQWPSEFHLDLLSPSAARVTLGHTKHRGVLGSLETLPWLHREDKSAKGGFLSVHWQSQPLAFSWLYKGQAILQDHPQTAYRLTPSGIRHTRVQQPTEQYFGLGEISGVLQRNSRRFRLEPRDACNYDAEFSDPLYKHIPLYLTRHSENCWSALLYDQPHPMVFDFGCERHHYHGLYTYTSIEQADFVRYLIFAADGLPELIQELTRLIGRPELPPRWSLGYLASGMAYTDAPDPVKALQDFANRLHEEQIPCDGFHLSSGYTLHGGNRYVFHWNRQTIPDPDGLVAGLKARGLRVIANVKPALLQNHPAYTELADKGCFIRNQDLRSLVASFWGGQASWLDFTNPDARAWWQKNIQKELLDRGIEGIWNDNNEFAFEEAALNAWGEATFPSEQIYSMATASYEAQAGYGPYQDKRPFLVSRSASLGVQKLAQTWSGDNTSSWKSLRFCSPISLGLGLSGFAHNGHDVGGFFGDPPSPELFLRWTQQAVAYPRFSIHSWKEPPTEPWSFLEVYEGVKRAIHLRYRLLPYLYSLVWLHSQTGAPIHRPLIYEFAELWEDPGFHSMLGPFLLFPMLGEPGLRHISLNLPEGWYDWHSRDYHQGHFEYPAPLHQVPVLVRTGSIIPLGPVMPSISPEYDTSREVLLFPHKGEGSSSFTLYEDDGETLAYRQGEYKQITFIMNSRPDQVQIEVLVSGEYPLPYSRLEVKIATDDPRPLKVRSSFKTIQQDHRAMIFNTMY
ncbi:TIM-barrel domain-containing protein [uncultured Meiothermus sp.]|jgi:alpha-glucosidase|uniref:TIM-barrel domain-containing protein n=1 Tax=uncultured Meiothermus sp. TaxID=157471 RepID=UPI002605163A|nr:TIM-barrel domain-containing protein [uncultured Meiothermus sp.]